MHFEHVTQRVPESLATGDVIDIFGGEEFGYTSGRYTVADLSQDGEVTIIGSGVGTGGMIAVIHVGVSDD